jgi:hypothetical protein
MEANTTEATTTETTVEVETNLVQERMSHPAPGAAITTTPETVTPAPPTVAEALDLYRTALMTAHKTHAAAEAVREPFTRAKTAHNAAVDGIRKAGDALTLAILAEAGLSVD